METIIAAVVVLAVVALALWYILRSKKNGAKCIGCPDSAHCSAKSCSSCQMHKE